MAMLRNTDATYGAAQRAFHWIMAILVIGMLILGKYIHGLDADNPAEAPIKSGLGGLHKATGMLILFLVALRIGWTLANVKPALPSSVPSWQRIASRVSHVLLYVLMVCMPVSGYVMSSYVQRPVDFYGLFRIPPLPVEKSIDMARSIFDIHEIMAGILATLIVIHLGAALKHHFIDRDNVLRRMLKGE